MRFRHGRCLNVCTRLLIGLNRGESLVQDSSNGGQILLHEVGPLGKTVTERVLRGLRAVEHVRKSLLELLSLLTSCCKLHHAGLIELNQHELIAGVNGLQHRGKVCLRHISSVSW